VTGRARAYDQAAIKLQRALNEFRIQGVKTNIPFLVNVLSHKDFLSGTLNTRFIENHPELFRFPESFNKAHKLVGGSFSFFIPSSDGKKQKTKQNKTKILI